MYAYAGNFCILSTDLLCVYASRVQFFKLLLWVCCAVIATRLCLWLKYDLDFLRKRDGQWTPVLLLSCNRSLIGWCAGDLSIPSGCAGGSLNRGKVCALTWATLLMRALPMPFPERQREALTDMLWLTISFIGNKSSLKKNNRELYLWTPASHRDPPWKQLCPSMSCRSRSKVHSLSSYGLREEKCGINKRGSYWLLAPRFQANC